MKFKKQDFDPTNNEYSYELTDECFNRKVNLWITLDERNKLTNDEIFEIVKVIHDEFIDIKSTQFGDIAFKFGNKNIYAAFAIDPADTLSIDKIEELNDNEFKIYSEYTESKKAQLN